MSLFLGCPAASLLVRCENDDRIRAQKFDEKRCSKADVRRCLEEEGATKKPANFHMLVDLFRDLDQYPDILAFIFLVTHLQTYSSFSRICIQGLIRSH